ncbi:MAG TPA: IS630 family transposase [Gammaproteobacteria bacterium]|nr:IS630 family transposase [Gammaproteobacteria bacterium]
MLNSKDREQILDVIKSAKDAKVIYRANALNLRHKGLSAAEVADFLEITPRTVFNIQRNYAEGGLAKALHDDPRPGTPVQFDAHIKSKIVALVCSDPPEGFDRWTLDLIKEEAEKNKYTESISRETIRIILREHDLKPWQQKSWCVPSLDEEFIKRMEDVLKVYEQPYNAEIPVVCVDEKPIQLLDEVRPASGLSPGKVKKIDYEYKRNGTANVFCAVEPKKGLYINSVTKNRKAKEFAKFISSVEKKYRGAKKIILVMDNLNIHCEKSLVDFYGTEKGKQIWSRFEVHYTPKHGSWLNQAEIAINMYARQSLGKTRIPDIELLKKKTTSWVKYINRKKVIIQWKFNRSDAREKFDY